MDRNDIKLKLLEVLNKSDFHKVLQDQGISEAEDIVVEVKFNSNQPQSLAASQGEKGQKVSLTVDPQQISLTIDAQQILLADTNQLASQIIAEQQNVIASVKRVCPCDPNNPKAGCCFQ